MKVPSSSPFIKRSDCLGSLTRLCRPQNPKRAQSLKIAIAKRNTSVSSALFSAGVTSAGYYTVPEWDLSTASLLLLLFLLLQQQQRPQQQAGRCAHSVTHKWHKWFERLIDNSGCRFR